MTAEKEWSEECVDGEENNDQPMTEDMMAFFRQTVLHRLQREKEKIELEKEAGTSSGTWFMSEFRTADQVIWSSQSEATVLPPPEPQNELRRREAQRLYGKDAEDVLSVETLMRVRFDQEFDKSKPALWPNIPLRI